MVKKKSGKRKVSRRRKTVSKRSPVRPAKARSSRMPLSKRKTASRKKSAPKRSGAPRAKGKGRPAAARRKTAAPARRGQSDADLNALMRMEEDERDPSLGIQSGDTMGLSRELLAAPESVEELVEEGQAFEAGIVSGVENAPDADRGPVKTRQVPEDDVPEEYLDQERDRN